MGGGGTGSGGPLDFLNMLGQALTGGNQGGNQGGPQGGSQGGDGGGQAFNQPSTSDIAAANVQGATTAPTDPSTGGALQPAAGEQSGSQSPNWLASIASLVNPASPASARTPAGPQGAPAWFQRTDPKDMYTQPGDPSAAGGPAYAGMDPGSGTPSPRRSAPAPSPAPGQAPPGGMARQPAAADPSTQADVPTQGGGRAAPSPYTYDPSTDPWAAAGVAGPGRGGGATTPETPTPDPSTSADVSTQGGGRPAQEDAKTDTTTPPAAQPTSGGPDTANAPTAPPTTGPSAATGPPAADQAGGQPRFDPMRMLTDILFGGPQAIQRDLASIAQQILGGGMQGIGGQPPGTESGQPPGPEGGGSPAAPWLAQGQRAPRGTNPQDYPQASPEQLAAIRRRQNVPGIDAQGRPTAGTSAPAGARTQPTVGPSGGPGGSGLAGGYVPSAAGGTLPGQARAPAPPPPAPNSPAASNPATQIPRPDLTANMPQATPTYDAPVAHAGFGPDSVPANRTRPGHYGGVLTVNGRRFRYGTGGGPHGSLPYGTYYLHPKGVGSIGRRIGAWAGISDSNNSGNNTVSRDPKTGVARRGVEIHPSSSGYTDGCIGIMDHRGFRDALNQASRNASIPLILEVRPDGSASISPMSRAPSSVATRGAGRQGLMGDFPQGASASPAEQLANAAYDRMPPRYGSRQNRREWENFRRSGDVEDRRGENPGNDIARSWSEGQNDAARADAFGRSRGPRPERRRPTDPRDPMAEALGLYDLYRGGPRRVARQY
jgi:hypothetical protein